MNIGTGYFDPKFGNWLPDEPEEIAHDFFGNPIYKGEEVYYIEGCDEVFVEYNDAMFYGMENYIDEIVYDYEHRNEISLEVDLKEDIMANYIHTREFRRG